MTQTELDRLVAQIGEELLARVAPGGVMVKKGEGLNLPDQVCPGCVQRCVQTCARNAKEIIALLKLSNQRYHQTLIIVTHDRDIALQADRIISFGDGHIVRDEAVRA